MKDILALPSFERSAKRLIPAQKKRLAKSLEKFNYFVATGEAPFGFGFKKINHAKYEFRVDIRLRVVVKAKEDAFCLVLVGSHNEIKRYLREYK